MENPPIRSDAKQANKACFIRFEANKYSLHINLYSIEPNIAAHPTPELAQHFYL
jgi:hypothetical protein